MVLLKEKKFIFQVILTSSIGLFCLWQIAFNPEKNRFIDLITTLLIYWLPSPLEEK
jgi:hypothetical protein